MFSGIIRHTGVIKKNSGNPASGLSIQIESALFDKELMEGDSVAVSGVCLTISEIGSGIASFHVGSETLRVTNLKNQRPGSVIHLEPSLRLGESIDGHFVYGHIDTLARFISSSLEGQTYRFIFSVPLRFKKFLVSKGSVAIEGVSLTVGEVFIFNDLDVSLKESLVGEVNPEENFYFSVYIIPHTLNNTKFSSIISGEILNLEIDPICRYAVNAIENQMTG
ncbi:MAG TPA: riboflavin synthase [Oligoflexia bacterium]|nr:riboflavin synthase [Oligoflexia bacterium]HMP47258.1 riboflavin synthase [Oligoflexia bacterium]